MCIKSYKKCKGETKIKKKKIIRKESSRIILMVTAAAATPLTSTNHIKYYFIFRKIGVRERDKLNNCVESYLLIARSYQNQI